MRQKDTRDVRDSRMTSHERFRSFNGFVIDPVMTLWLCVPWISIHRERYSYKLDNIKPSFRVNVTITATLIHCSCCYGCLLALTRISMDFLATHLLHICRSEKCSQQQLCGNKRYHSWKWAKRQSKFPSWCLFVRTTHCSTYQSKGFLLE